MVTYVFENGTVTTYLNGELCPAAMPTGKSIVINSAYGSKIEQITDFENLGIVIGGFWNDNYTSDQWTVYIDDVLLYDKALSANDVHTLYMAEKNEKQTVESKAAALDKKDGETIGEIKDELATSTDPEAVRGWYYINSSSGWETNYVNSDLQTAKSLLPLSKNEAIKNEIDYDELPTSVQKALGSADVVKNGNRAGYKDDIIGFIYTGSADFTRTGATDSLYYYSAGKKNNDGKPSETLDNIYSREQFEKDNPSIDESTYAAGKDKYAALTLPEEGERSGVKDENGKITSPLVFFIDSAGYLRCFYNNGSETKSNSTAPRSSVSYVYYKEDSQDIKVENLQRALGLFSAALENKSPKSRVAAVRFSSNNVPNYDFDKLVVLDWTNDSEAATKMLSLVYGDGKTIKGDESVISAENENENQSPITQYNFGMTGGTNTLKGLQAFDQILKPRMERDEDERDNIKEKYIIIFTDGKDTNVSEGKTAEVEDTKKLAQTLKEEGYTIFYVLLTGGAFELDDAVKIFVASIAGDDTTGEKEYADLENKYIFHTSKTAELNSIFNNDILKVVSQNLTDYSIKDYIDPRFDLVDRAGTKYVLGEGGSVTYGAETKVIDDNGITFNPTSTTFETDATCKLCYDSAKKMYYLRWDKYDIPVCTVNDPDLAVWRSTFHIVAKEDFIGGNAILTNGNEKNENYVFSPEDNDASSAAKDLIKTDDNKYVSKGFPRTTANVRLLELKMDDSGKNLYLGESFKPSEILDTLSDTIDSNYYFEYIKRYYDNLGDKTTLKSAENALAYLLS